MRRLERSFLSAGLERRAQIVERQAAPLRTSTNTYVRPHVIRLLQYVRMRWDQLRGRIATGTPEGVGHSRKPPLWMKPGDVLEVEITGIGVLRTRIVDEK